MVALALLLGFFLWLQHIRFSVITTPQEVTYKVDRRTGKAWVLYGDRENPRKPRGRFGGKGRGAPAGPPFGDQGRSQP